MAKNFEDLRAPRGRVDVDIKAESWKPENPLDEVFPDVKPGLSSSKGGVKDPTGTWTYHRMILPKGEGLAISSSPDLWSEPGYAYFTADIIVPALCAGAITWMSLTPMEIWSQTSGIQAATGHTVVGGLGMGWLLRQIAKKPTVTSITVVEKDQRLLDWYGNTICANTPKVKDIICADIYDVARNFDFKKTKFVLDIWESNGRAVYDRQLQELRDDGARVWAWGCARDPRPKFRQDDPRRKLTNAAHLR